MTYEELVQQVNNRSSYGSENGYHGAFAPVENIELKEINAWTYWQGAGVRDPKILVLGQDWGSSKIGTNYFKAIAEMISNGTVNSEVVQYFKYVPGIAENKKDFETDRNLAKGLGKLKVNGKLKYPDVLHKRYEELFFTNLIPGYRKDDKSTGGFKATWITEKVKTDFIDLINILSPKVVLCLGKDTFVRAAKICGHGNPLKKDGWNKYLDSEFEPLKVELEQNPEKFTYLYPLPHPGYFGKMNRGAEKMEDDWERLSDWVEALELLE